jgi:fatty acid desaturase
VVTAIYGGFLLWTWYFRSMPLWLAAPIGTILVAWHGSLQHETIHNHPTRWRWVNILIGGIPLSLWIPYARYRRLHLRHHRAGGRILTDPLRDPESFYLPTGKLATLGPVARFLAKANCTLVGRLILGPTLAMAAFFASEAKVLATGNRHRLGVWLIHGLGVAVVLGWVVGVCRIPASLFIALVVYPALSLSLVRYFAEHRAHPDPSLRTAVVEANPFWSLLFLNNNLHIAHHADPAAPWYELPGIWRRTPEAEKQRAAQAGLIYRGGYSAILRRFLLKPVISIELPPAQPAIE